MAQASTKEAELLLPYYQNFPLFCNLVWKSIGLPSLTPIQTDIAKLLQNPPMIG